MKMKVGFIIPTRNEEKSIGKVLSKIPPKWKRNVIVVDTSEDKTATIARKLGAKVIIERKKGKGIAVIRGLREAVKLYDSIVVLDGDDTYNPKEAVKLLKPLELNKAEAVIGSRLKNVSTFSPSHFFGNLFLTFLVSLLLRYKVKDVCSGFFALHKNVAEFVIKYCEAEGFDFEIDMLTKLIKAKYRVYFVPISYRKRIGKSKLNIIRDSILILRRLIKNLKGR